MKGFILSAVVVAANAAVYGGGSNANDGYYTTTAEPCTGYGCEPTYTKPVYPTYTKPVYPTYTKPVYPETTTVYPVIPTVTVKPVVPTTVTIVKPVVPTVTVTVTATLAPETTEIIKKLPQTLSCKKWNKKVNDNKCEVVNNVKCNLKGSKKSKYDACNEATCCSQATVTVTVAPAPTEVTKATIVSCAQFCAQEGHQCIIATEGACALEGPFGDYLQCSKDLCCNKNAPVKPSPQIVSCAQVVAGNGWSCKFVPDFSCSVTGASGKFPACTYDICCLFPIPSYPQPNPCSKCTDVYGSCPPTCPDAPDTPNPCKYCDLPYAYCPSWCSGGNKGYSN